MISYTCTNQIAFQKWFIGNDIRTILLADEDIQAQVGENIYPLVCPEGVKGDIIIYYRDEYGKRQDMHTMVYQDKCIVNILAIADNYDNAVQLASLIDNALTGQHITESGNKFYCMLDNSSETFQDNKYVETLSFEIK